MELYKKIYYKDGMKKRKRIIRSIKKDKKIKGVYCICTYESSNFLLEILDIKEIYKEFNRNKKYILYGIAYTKKEAIELLPSIIDDLYKESKI